MLRFLRDFEAPALLSRKNCVLCRVLGIVAFKASDDPVPVDESIAQAALDAGAAVEAALPPSIVESSAA